MTDPIVISAARRTPIGAYLGSLSPLTAPDLGAAAITAALTDAEVTADTIDELLMGCVLSAGQGQAPARQAARAAGLADSTRATTLNKVCGSGMKAVMMACDHLALNHAQVMVAGGMEAMSRAPHLLANHRSGQKVGPDVLADHMMRDGLEDAYEPGRPMGSFGEMAAAKYDLDRTAQDGFAMESLLRAKAAQETGAFEAEITPLSVPQRKGQATVAQDERPTLLDPAKIPGLRPAFEADGTITAASASANADGAAALVLTRRSVAQARGMPVLARIVGYAAHAQDPAWYTTAPIPAIRKLLDSTGWQADQVDLWEINEAFAVVAMAAAAEIGIPRDRLNVNGGACALGHPIGATGARLIVTLLHALRARGQRRGIAALCIGGGEATALALEIDM